MCIRPKSSQEGNGSVHIAAAPRARMAEMPAAMARRLCRGLGDWHRDQEGALSILSVFAVLLLTMLLGMVMNVGRHVDGKIRLQNAADATAYSGSAGVARGLNALAFSNHLLCDVFAVTAFMREARDRNAERYVPAILAAWDQIGPVFQRSGFPKFERLGAAIVRKTPLERQLVQTYSDWAAAASERILPLMEEILRQEMIPEYQRAVVRTFPELAQMAAAEAARRDGNPSRGRGLLLGVLWRTGDGTFAPAPVGGAMEGFRPALPVVDPVFEAALGNTRYLARARAQRRRWAEHYLGLWNYYTMYIFDREAKMCQFGSLWRSFTCGQLRQLLEVEYPSANLPHLLRTEGADMVDPQEELSRDYTFVGVAYWHRMPELLPGLFRTPSDGDAVACAEARVFIPRRRLVWLRYGPSSGEMPIGGVPGDFPTLPPEGEPTPPAPGGEGGYRVGRQPGRSEAWDLFNQNWTAQLVPVTHPAVPAILQTPPPLAPFVREGYQLPSLAGLSADDMARLNTH